MKIKKITISLFIAIIMLSCLTLNVVFAAGSVSISNKTVNLNENVSVTVVMPSGAVGYSGTISYDSSKLEYLSGADNKINNGTLKVANANMDLRTSR